MALEENEKMTQSEEKQRENETNCPEKEESRAFFNKKQVGKQRQSALGKRRHQELGLSNMRNADKPAGMNNNRRRRAVNRKPPEYPPHPSKLPNNPMHQRRQRKLVSSTQLVAPDAVANSTSAGLPNQLQSLSHNQQQQPQHASQASLPYVCSGCQQPIRDRFLLSACDKYWHDSCLKCHRCQAKLGELGSSLYAAANMNLCRQDYFEMFGQKAICAVCDKLIYASEMVMRARENVYHLECFACQLCGLRFCVGDRFHLCENKIVCQYDYDEHIYPLQIQQQQQQQPYGIHYNPAAGTCGTELPVTDLAAAEGRAWQVESDQMQCIPNSDHQFQHSQTTPNGRVGGAVFHAMESCNGRDHSKDETRTKTMIEESRKDDAALIALAKPIEKQISDEISAPVEESVACEREIELNADNADTAREKDIELAQNAEEQSPP